MSAVGDLLEYAKAHGWGVVIRRVESYAPRGDRVTEWVEIEAAIELDRWADRRRATSNLERDAAARLLRDLRRADEARELRDLAIRGDDQ